MRAQRIAWLVCAALVGCGPASVDEDAGLDAGRVDAGSDAAFDAGTDRCIDPDRVCPELVPPPGLECEGELRCSYTNYETRCADGAWRLTNRLCTACPWPVAEGCSDPSTAALPGATLSIGPPDEARAFAPDEAVDAVWGPQGSPMVAYALRIEGAEPASCVSYEGEIDDGLVRRIGPRAVRFHCVGPEGGTTRTIFTEMAPWPCEPRDYPVTLRLQVAGVDGEVSARVLVRGDACP
jgi:hypothetical protein